MFTLCKFQGYGAGNGGVKYSTMDKIMLFQAISMMGELKELCMPELGEFVRDEEFVLDPLLSMDSLVKVLALSVKRLQGVGEVVTFESLPGYGCGCEGKPK